jgi:hypothetical protein
MNNPAQGMQTDTFACPFHTDTMMVRYWCEK